VTGLWRGVVAACAYDLTLRMIMPRICNVTENLIDYFFGPVSKE
jgi:hypothetical protein